MSRPAENAPAACLETLKSVEADPLEPGADALAHLRDCPACAEARVLWLAQEEAPLALAPAGYFERLPARILGKLPSGRRSGSRTGWLAVAAALLLLTAGGSFWAGRINREPLVEASNSKAPAELKELPSELPFHDRYEVIEQFQSLTAEEAKALLKQLETKEAGSNP